MKEKKIVENYINLYSYSIEVHPSDNTPEYSIHYQEYHNLYIIIEENNIPRLLSWINIKES